MTLLTVLVLCFAITAYVVATPPPGYVKKPDNDKDPPKYQYGYDVKDGIGGRQGHQESRDGIYAKGMYYVTVPGSGQRVEYFADDWGYHPLVSYNSKTKGSSSNAQFAFGEKAVAALHQAGGGGGVLSGSVSTTNSQSHSQALPFIQPGSNQLGQGVFSSSSSSLSNNQGGGLIVNHQQQVGGGILVGIPTREQQRLTATYQVGTNGPAVSYASGNSIVDTSSGGISSSHLVQGSGVQTETGQNHGQYLVEVAPGSGSSYQHVQGASYAALQQPAQYAQAFVGGSVAQSNEGSAFSSSKSTSSSSTSYSSQNNFAVEYGTKLSAATLGSVSGVENDQHHYAVTPAPLQQVFTATPAPLQHSSLQPIVVADYHEHKEVQSVTPSPACPCPSSTASSVLAGNSVSTSYQSSTGGSLSVLSDSNVNGHIVSNHVTTERPTYVQSTTLTSPFFLSGELTSSGHSASSSSFESSNNGDSGHINVESYVQPSHGSSVSYPSPTPPTIVITPKPQPVASAFSSSNELLAPFQAALSIAQHSDSLQFSHLNEEQHVTANQAVQPVKLRTVVEIQKAIPIEVSQESLNAADEAQIRENGIPFDYIKHIVNSAENIDYNEQVSNSQGNYGYKLSSAPVIQFTTGHDQTNSQQSQNAASIKQIQAQIEGEAEEEAEQQKKQQNAATQGQTQTSGNEENVQTSFTQLTTNEHVTNSVSQESSGASGQTATSYSQQLIGNHQHYGPASPVTGPSHQSHQNQLQHEAGHQYHKQLLTHTYKPQQSYYRQQTTILRPQYGQLVVPKFRSFPPVRYGEKIYPRGHRFNHVNHNFKHNAHLRLNENFLRNHHHVQEANKQISLNQQIVSNNHHIFNAGQKNQHTRLPKYRQHYNAEITIAHEIPFDQKTLQDEGLIHPKGHLLNQHLIDEELNKQQQTFAQESALINQQQFEFLKNNQASFQQEVINFENGQQQINQALSQPNVNAQVVTQGNPNVVNTQQYIQVVAQQQPIQGNANVGANQQVVQQQQTIQNVVSKINKQQTQLEQQYNQQLLANTVRNPSSSALVQQAINPNHQLKLKFVRQPEGDKQADVENVYNQQLVEESKQDSIQSDKQLLNNEVPLKLLLESERQLEGGSQQISVLPTPASLSQEHQLQFDNLQSVSQSEHVGVENNAQLHEQLNIQSTVLNQPATNYVESSPQHPSFSEEHTKIFPVHHVEHTKVVELKKPYPVPYPVRVEQTRVVNVDRPYAIPHPVPIEVTKLVAVDRPYPYPQPYPVPHPVPVPYAVPHPVQVPVNHYIHYPHIVKVPYYSHGKETAPYKPQMPPNPHFQKAAAHAYIKSNYGYGGGAQRPNFSYSNNFFNGQSQSLKSGRTQLWNNQQLLSRHRPKSLNIEYGFKPPLIPSPQIAVDPEPEPFSN